MSCGRVAHIIDSSRISNNITLFKSLCTRAVHCVSYINCVMLERNFKKKIQQRLEGNGWVFVQLVAGAGVPKGFPDTLAISPSGYICFVEWKKNQDANKQPLQEYWVNKLNNMGHEAFFVFPENVERWLEHVGAKADKPLFVAGGLSKKTR